MRGGFAIAGACAILAAVPAAAAGGAHVIDDSEVETPGLCHLENWGIAGSDRSYFVNLSPACTFRDVPWLEVGGFFNRSFGRGSDTTLVGLAPKVTIRPEASGLGVGAYANLGINPRTGRADTAAAIVPVTVPLRGGVRLNINGGWQWARGMGGERFAGAQIEVALVRGPVLMLERFDRTRGRGGGQAGLRWTVDRGRIDIDLLASRYADGRTRRAVTFSVIRRR